MTRQELINHCEDMINRNADRDTEEKRRVFTEHFIFLRYLKGETTEEIFKNVYYGRID